MPDRRPSDIDALGAMTIGDLLELATTAFRRAGLPSADLDARLLTAQAAGVSVSDVRLRRDRTADASVSDSLEGFVARRVVGEPVHRIIGRRAFYDHEFGLSKYTLEPRPETEILVDEARPFIADVIEDHGHCLLADIGTGTGAIAISLLALFDRCKGIGVDISPGALQTANENASRAGVAERFLAKKSNYLDEVYEVLDIIVSNPPYIRSGDIEGLDEGVRLFDPQLALDGGEDGLDAYRAIAKGAQARLSETGAVLLEIGQGQETEISTLFAESGFVLVKSAKDLAGITRVLTFQREGAA